MEADGVDVLMLSVGSDLPYFCGYEAMPLERITMLVVPRDGDATLVVPGLEAARVTEREGVFTVTGWAETDDPIAIIADLAGPAANVAVAEILMRVAHLHAQPFDTPRRVPVFAEVEVRGQRFELRENLPAPFHLDFETVREAFDVRAAEDCGGDRAGREDGDASPDDL